jgi:hypothetical protein
VCAEVQLKYSKEPYTVIPSTYYPSQDGEFYCRIISGDAQLADNLHFEVSPWQSKCKSADSINGKWTLKSSGGPLSSPKFYLNPQFEIRFTEDCTFHFVLRQTEKAIGAGIEVITNESHITKTDQHKLADGKRIGKAAFTNAKELSRTNISLKKSQSPICIVPCAYKSSTKGAFTLFVYGTTDFKLIKSLKSKSSGKNKRTKHKVASASSSSHKKRSAKPHKSTGGSMTFQKARNTASGMADLYANF